MSGERDSKPDENAAWGIGPAEESAEPDEEVAEARAVSRPPTTSFPVDRALRFVGRAAFVVALFGAVMNTTLHGIEIRRLDDRVRALEQQARLSSFAAAPREVQKDEFASSARKALGYDNCAFLYGEAGGFVLACTDDDSPRLHEAEFAGLCRSFCEPDESQALMHRRDGFVLAACVCVARSSASSRTRGTPGTPL